MITPITTGSVERKGHEEAVRVFVRLGAGLEFTGRDGITPVWTRRSNTGRGGS